MSKHKEFAARFDLLCAEAGLPKTQNELGRALGVSGTTVWKLKNGDILPKMGNAIEWADLLNVTVEYLLTGEGPKHRTTRGLPEGWGHIAEVLDRESEESVRRAQSILEAALGIQEKEP